MAYEGAVPVKLGGSLTTPTAEGTHRAIRDALEACESLALDCSEATEIDVSFLQILVGAQRAAERAGKTIALASPAQGELADALRRCGFAPAEGTTALASVFSAHAS